MEQQQDSSQQSPNETEQKTTDKSKGSRRYIGWIILAIVLVAGAYYGYSEYEFLQNHVDTDDAQTAGNINPVLPRVSGYVAEVRVDDNEHVEKGQILVQVDSTEYVLQVQKAKSALQNARASLDVAKSSLQTSKVSLQKAQQDLNRAKDLYQGGATTKQSYDDASAAYTKAQAEVETAKKKVAASRTRITEEKNALEDARLQLSYTNIKAPSAGVISTKNVQVGQLIKPGQPLMSITDKKDVWVIANFKETQIKYIKVGQKVDIEVDAYPDKEFTGTVQSVAGGTGAKYSMLPADNATGNFVKVVQRVPVKITLNDERNSRDALPLGLNVTTTININQKIDTSGTAMQRTGK